MSGIASEPGFCIDLRILVSHLATNRGVSHMPCPKDIETFLADYPPEVRDVALAARRLLNRAIPGAEETLGESASVIGYGYGPGYKGVVCTLILSRSGVKQSSRPAIGGF
jgi:hypothetical protein